MSIKSKLYTTKQLPELTGFSVSYFCKARLGGYGPKFIRIRASGRVGKILYREDDLQDWLAAGVCDPEACHV